MKKRIALFLAALMLLALVGCAEKPVETQPTETAKPTQTTSPPETTQPTETTVPVDPNRDPQLGNFRNNVYTNEFLGIRCQVDESWSVYSDAEMAQLNGLVLDTMTDADLVEQLKNANVAYLFYAAADEGLKTMNVVLETMGRLEGLSVDAKTYAEVSAQQLPAALQSMGFTDVTATVETITFAGAEHPCVVVHGLYSGVDFYEKLVCIKLQNYVAAITVGSYYEDATDALLSMFTALEP